MTRPISPFNAQTLTGRAGTHLIEVEALGCLMHRAVAAPFLAMRRAAERSGIDLMPASAFRDFTTQVGIWNDKWTGRRALHDRSGRPIEVSALAPAARVEAILVWSAAPGASRHHWGTELDVWDRAAVGPDYRLALTPAEYAPDGPFAKLTAWLDRHMDRYGFYRPYQRDRGGVQPEPWHLSHAPTAALASRRLRLATLAEALEAVEVEGKAALIEALPTIYRQYVRNVEPPPRRLSRGARSPAGGRASARARSARGSGRA